MLSRSFVTSLALGLVLLGSFTAPASARSHSTPTPAATPTPPPEDPAVTAIARHEFVDWQAGIVDKSRYADTFSTGLSDSLIAQVSKSLSTAGALQRTQWLGPYPASQAQPPPASQGARTYLFRMFCSVRPVYEIIAIAPDGKIAGIEFRDNLK